MECLVDGVLWGAQRRLDGFGRPIGVGDGGEYLGIKVPVSVDPGAVGEFVERLGESPVDPPLGQRQLSVQRLEPSELGSECFDLVFAAISPAAVGLVAVGLLACGLTAAVRHDLVEREVRTPTRHIQRRTRRVGAFGTETVWRDVDLQSEAPSDMEVLPTLVVGPTLDQSRLLQFAEVIDDCLGTHADIVANLGDIAGFL